MKEIESYIEENYPDDEILLADGFEGAFMGIVESNGSHPKALYNEDKCVDILIERDGMDYEEAIEFFQFNVTGAYVGEYTPAFIAPLYYHLPDETLETSESHTRGKRTL